MNHVTFRSIKVFHTHIFIEKLRIQFYNDKEIPHMYTWKLVAFN